MWQKFLVVAMLTVGAVTAPVNASDWPDFRGPRGDGHAEAQSVPTKWSETEGIRWKVSIPGKGWSTPVAGSGKLWLTSASEDGRIMSVFGIDATNGGLLRSIEVFTTEDPEVINDTNSHASPSPLLDGNHLYVHFGTNGTACIDIEANRIVWRRRDLKLAHKEGPGSSPVLWNNLILFHCDGTDVQYVVALDKRSGETVWRTDRSVDYSAIRDDFRKAYSTPLVVDFHGKTQLISTGPQMAAGYDAATGREIWRVQYEGFSNVARPLVMGDLVLLNTGYMKPQLWGVRLGGSGDVTDSHVVWKFTRSVSNKPSPVIVDGVCYFVSDKGGVLTAVNATNGEEVWTQRLGGNYSASLLVAGGNIYACDHDGATHVFKPGATYTEVAVNHLENGCMASPIVVDSSLILRTTRHLYRIDGK